MLRQKSASDLHHQKTYQQNLQTRRQLRQQTNLANGADSWFAH